MLIIATGGQGEPRAALGRIASAARTSSSSSDGDTVIFSSRIIPGNEIAIGRIMNQLSDLGVQIVTERQAHVHVSGHPGRPELIEMYKWVRPEIVVPVHGEARHLAEHARLALGHGVPHAVVQKNGDVIRLAPGEPEEDRRGPRRPAGARRRRDPSRRRRDRSTSAAGSAMAG